MKKKIQLISFNLFQLKSRCAMIRYGKLSDAQILKKVIEVCKMEQVSYTDEGLEAIVFTAQGDMRQVIRIKRIIRNRPVFHEINPPIPTGSQQSAVYSSRFWSC